MMNKSLMELRYVARPDLPTDQRFSTAAYSMFDTFIPTRGINRAEAWQDRETDEMVLFYPAGWDIRQSSRMYGTQSAQAR